MTYLIGLGFLIGIQVLTQIFFGINIIFGVPLIPVIGQIFFVIPVIFISRLIFAGKIQFKNILIRFNKWPTQEKLLSLVLAFIVISPLIVSFWMPVTSWDAITLYDFRAIVILDTGYIKDTLERASITGYPLFTTLAHWLAYSIGLSTPMLLYPLLYGAFLLVSYHQIHRLTNRLIALLGTLFLAVAPKMFDQSLVAYTNMPYTVYLILGASFIYLWKKQHQRHDFILGLLFSLFSLWVRSFPFLIVQLGLLLIYLNISKIFKLAIVFLASIFFLRYLPVLDFNQALMVLDYLKWSIFQYYLPYWVLFGFTLAAWFKSPKRDYYWPLLITGYTFLLFMGTYIYSFGDIKFTVIPDTIQRTAMFINLAIIWFTIITLHDTFKKNNLI